MPWPPEAKLRRLARKAAGGDRNAFAALYRALSPPLRRYLARRVPEPDRVDDLTMGVFETLIHKLDRYDPARGTVRAFVVTIARNRLIDEIRARRHVRADAATAEKLERLPDLCADPEGALANRHEFEQLTRAIEDAPRETRELLSLRYGDGLSTPEVAEALGISPAAARKRLSRALLTIRTQISEASTQTTGGVPNVRQPATN